MIDRGSALERAHARVLEQAGLEDVRHQDRLANIHGMLGLYRARELG